MWHSYKPGFILIRDRTATEKLQESPRVFFYIVVRHGVKISMDGGFPYPQRCFQTSSGAGLLLLSIWAAHTHPSYKNTSALRAGKAQITGGGRRTCIGQGQTKQQMKVSQPAWYSRMLHFSPCFSDFWVMMPWLEHIGKKKKYQIGQILLGCTRTSPTIPVNPVGFHWGKTVGNISPHFHCHSWIVLVKGREELLIKAGTSLLFEYDNKSFIQRYSLSTTAPNYGQI